MAGSIVLKLEDPDVSELHKKFQPFFDKSVTAQAEDGQNFHSLIQEKFIELYLNRLFKAVSSLA
jgi:hypothetical protein